MESKWINFIEDTEPSKRKTKIFFVKTKDNNIILGCIKWYAAWRCYAFYPAPNTVFEKTCLQNINTFIEKLMLNRKVVVNNKIKKHLTS